jgi:hypothetical protein
MLRYNTEVHMGRYQYYRNDHTVYRVLRNLFHPADRFLLQDIFVLLGNQILSRVQRDSKFDYKLFPLL